MRKPGSFMAKIDLASAYRHVPLNPSNYRDTGFKWCFKGHTKPTYMVDTRLPSGTLNACLIDTIEYSGHSFRTGEASYSI